MPRAEQTAELDHDLVLSVDGPGVRRASVDVPLFLELCASFFQLVKANASEDAVSLDLTGIRLVDKHSAALAAGVSSAALARASAEQALRQIAGDDAPRGLARLADRARSAVSRLPEGHTAKVVAGPWVRPIVVSRSQDLGPFDAILAIRAVPLRVGGKKPAARFQSRLEGEFTLDTKADQARALGAHLYEEVEIVAKVARDPDGNIESGYLESFACVAPEGPATAWRAWYQAIGGAEWDQIEDLRTELKG
jgi:hypothetical protein